MILNGYHSEIPTRREEKGRDKDGKLKKKKKKRGGPRIRIGEHSDGVGGFLSSRGAQFHSQENENACRLITDDKNSIGGGCHEQLTARAPAGL